MTVIVRDAASGKWRQFLRPLDIVTALRPEEVLPALRKIEAECTRNQRYAAGFLSYEASPAFDAALTTRPPDAFPLLWFGLYDAVDDRALEDFARYTEIFEQLQELIRSGDTYQIN